MQRKRSSRVVDPLDARRRVLQGAEDHEHDLDQGQMSDTRAVHPGARDSAARQARSWKNAFKRWECSVAGDIVVSHQIEFAELGVKNAV